jgi:hypothetical protein
MRYCYAAVMSFIVVCAMLMINGCVVVARVMVLGVTV